MNSPDTQSSEPVFSLDDIQEAYDAGYYQGAGDDVWYKDHTSGGKLKDTASITRHWVKYRADLLEHK